MPDLVLQLLGFGLLFPAIWLCATLLQRQIPASGAIRQARMLALAVGFGGLIGATAWWPNAPYAFAWALPPLAARFLAVAACAFGVIALRAASLQSVGHLRLIAVMLLAYLGPLTGAIVILHLDRFDPTSPVSYGFFVIVLLLLAGAIAAFFRLPSDERGMTSGMLGLVGTLAGLWGLTLFIWPEGPWATIWPWPQDPLTSRLIAAMFLTIGAACHYAEGRAERRTVDLLCLIYGGGIAATAAIAALGGKPAFIAYAAFWALVAAQSLWGLVTDRAASPAPAPTRRG